MFQICLVSLLVVRLTESAAESKSIKATSADADCEACGQEQVAEAPFKRQYEARSKWISDMFSMDLPALYSTLTKSVSEMYRLAELKDIASMEQAVRIAESFPGLTQPLFALQVDVPADEERQTQLRRAASSLEDQSRKISKHIPALIQTLAEFPNVDLTIFFGLSAEIARSSAKLTGSLSKQDFQDLFDNFTKSAYTLGLVSLKMAQASVQTTKSGEITCTKEAEKIVHISALLTKDAANLIFVSFKIIEDALYSLQ